MLYSKAAALAPGRSNYWLKAQAIRGRAALQADFKLNLDSALPTEAEGDPDYSVSLTDADLRDAAKPLPPKELKPAPGNRSFDLKGDARTLFEDIAKAFKLDVVFDGEYPQGGPKYTFRMDDVDHREALYAFQSMTGSFAFPLGDRLFMVAKDTQQKRNELEPYASIVIPMPNTVTIQEAQELARAVQQVLELQKFGIDSLRRLVAIRGPISKVYPAIELFNDLAGARTELEVELEFLEVARTKVRNLGLTLPNTFNILSLPTGSTFTPPGGYFLKFGGGMTVFGILIGNGELIANETRGNSATLLRASVRSTDGAPATFHVGDRYPILTGGYFGIVGDEKGYTPPPQISFEDLGFNIKITPKVVGINEVAMEVDAEFKVLSGGEVNGIPIIANRKALATTRLRTGEWGVVSGMMSTSQARTVSGIAGLMQIPGLGPLLSRYNWNDESKELLILLKPRILSLPPFEAVTRTLWVGSETRMRIPL
jgi:general secretion pathway protein D